MSERNWIVRKYRLFLDFPLKIRMSRSLSFFRSSCSVVNELSLKKISAIP